MVDELTSTYVWVAERFEVPGIGLWLEVGDRLISHTSVGRTTRIYSSGGEDFLLGSEHLHLLSDVEILPAPEPMTREAVEAWLAS